MSGSVAQEAMTALLSAYDAVAACDLEALPASGLLEFLDGLEVLSCQLPTQSHRALARLQTQTTPQELGAKSWKDVPPWVDGATREQIEVDLVRVAVGVGPKELKETAALRLFLLDQDGPPP
ncbi:MAG: hypothetical protein K0U76_17185 [Actinomycetia bacterium]|nr:hypothetical protein [Actinomycetes bacterium]MCH9703083.1 hypothetical protein [Actinomycetes bacterium]MCH9762383.1 hypothetical protein [Actinomycetes bacterium]